MIATLFMYVCLITVFAYPLGVYLNAIDKKSFETYSRSMNWRQYAFSVLVFGLCNILLLVFMLHYQDVLPGNPQKFSGLSWALAFNTAVSFVTNTNWQAYAGESSLSMLSQSVGLAVQNFLSASTGLCVMFVLCRGLISKECAYLGSFWQDLKYVTYIFLVPITLFVSLLLVFQGVPQTYDSSAEYVSYESREHKTIPLGLVASQVAIKQLGTNGGGYFNVNSAHPLENPTPISNFIQVISILLIPAACCFYFGKRVSDMRQGYALYAVMLGVTVLSMFLMIYIEVYRADAYFPEGVSLAHNTEILGNMEGKETRIGLIDSVIWSVATTAASNGSVNSMLDSYIPLAAIVPLFLMQMGEVIFGGVGSGLYGMLCFCIVAVFISGLMIGRTPEYLGKKIEIREMKLVSIAILTPCILVLLALIVVLYGDYGLSSISNPGPHGFSQILYAYTSMGNNNGSAFGGFSSGLDIHLWLGGGIMYISRYAVIFVTIWLAGSLSIKKIVPTSAGTLKTHTISFCLFLVSIIIIVGALTFLPALVLGPVADGLL